MICRRGNKYAALLNPQGDREKKSSWPSQTSHMAVLGLVHSSRPNSHVGGITSESMSTDRDQAVSEGDYEDRNDHKAHQVSGSTKVGRSRFADKNRPATSTYPNQQTKKASNVHPNDGRLRTQLASIEVPQVYFLLYSTAMRTCKMQRVVKLLSKNVGPNKKPA